METRIAGRILVGALALGTIGELLFFDDRLGLNLPVAVAALLAAAHLARPRGRRVDRLDRWLAPLALVFAGFVALRADPALVLFDVPAALGLAVAGVAATAGFPVTRRSLLGLAVLGGWLGGALVGGAVRLAAALRPAVVQALPPGRRLAGLAPALRGIAIAFPLLAVFALLFAAADAVFARYLSDLLSWSLDLGDLPGRAAFVVAVAWAVGGLLFVAASPGDEVGRAEETVERLLPRPRLGATEGFVALLAVDLLFTLFVALQAAYLFGGRDTLAVTGFTYSEYARRGFLELIAVALLAGALVLALEATVERRSRPYLATAVALAALTAVVLGSAVARLRLYQDAYGWTELRFYALAAIGWLAIGVVATAVALVAGRSRWLLHALGVAGLAVAVAVNLVGPQAFVAAQNVARALDPSLVPPDGESGLDAPYLAGLGDDAVPALLAALPSLPPEERRVIGTALAVRLRDLEADAAARGWPSWNLARERARTLLEAARPRLPAGP